VSKFEYDPVPPEDYPGLLIQFHRLVRMNNNFLSHIDTLEERVKGLKQELEDIRKY